VSGFVDQSSIKEDIIDQALALIEYANEIIEADETIELRGDRGRIIVSMYQDNLEYIQLYLK